VVGVGAILSQIERDHNTMDKEILQGLLDNARTAKEAYWDAVRLVEKHIGLDIDELSICTDDAVDMDAEDLIKAVDHYNS